MEKGIAVTPSTIIDLHCAIIVGLNAVQYMAAEMAHSARTFYGTIAAEDARNADFNASRELVKDNVDMLRKTLIAVDSIMQDLGNFIEEPSEEAMEAINPAFGIVERAINA